MNGKHPCGECIGEIMEGKGNALIAEYFATAIAEEVGVDIKKHNKHLPERNKYDFSQSHTLLESGKVKHSWKFKKKNGKDH